MDSYKLLIGKYFPFVHLDTSSPTTKRLEKNVLDLEIFDQIFDFKKNKLIQLVQVAKINA